MSSTVQNSDEAAKWHLRLHHQAQGLVLRYRSATGLHVPLNAGACELHRGLSGLWLHRLLWNVEGNSNSRHGSGDGGPTNGGPLMAKQDKQELPWCFEHIANKIRVYLCHWLSKSVWAGPRLWRCVTVSWWSTDGLGVKLSIKQNLEGGRLGLSWAWSGTEVAGLSAKKRSQWAFARDLFLINGGSTVLL